jgi:hypothetical protein
MAEEDTQYWDQISDFREPGDWTPCTSDDEVEQRNERIKPSLKIPNSHEARPEEKKPRRSPRIAKLKESQGTKAERIRSLPRKQAGKNMKSPDPKQQGAEREYVTPLQISSQSISARLPGPIPFPAETDEAPWAPSSPGSHAEQVKQSLPQSQARQEVKRARRSKRLAQNKKSQGSSSQRKAVKRKRGEKDPGQGAKRPKADAQVKQSSVHLRQETQFSFLFLTSAAGPSSSELEAEQTTGAKYKKPGIQGETKP